MNNKYTSYAVSDFQLNALATLRERFSEDGNLELHSFHGVNELWFVAKLRQPEQEIYINKESFEILGGPREVTKEIYDYPTEDELLTGFRHELLKLKQ